MGRLITLIAFGAASLKPTRSAEVVAADVPPSPLGDYATGYIRLDQGGFGTGSELIGVSDGSTTVYMWFQVDAEETVPEGAYVLATPQALTYEEVIDWIVATLNGVVGFYVTATDAGVTANLANDNTGTAGNVEIEYTAGAGGPAFSTSGMSGGA